MTIRSRAADDSGNLETPRRGVDGRRRRRATCPCSIWDDRGRPAADDERHQRRRARRQVPLRRRRLHHRRPLLQGRRQHRHARRPPLDQRRARCSPQATFTGETRVRLAAGRPSRAGRDRRRHDLRRLLPRASRRLRGRRAATSPTAASTTRRCTRSPTASTAPNGVYSYGAGGVSRPSTFNATQLLGRRRLRRRRRTDTTPPTVSRSRRRRARPGSATAPTSRATFSEPMNAATINGSTVRAARRRRMRSSPRPSPTTPARGRRRSTRRAARASTTYTATVKGGAGGVKDIAGNALAADVTWSFTTAAPPPPPPDEGPGGPILVVASRGEPVQPVLRRDPPRRRPERVHRRPTSRASRRRCSRLRRRAPRRDAAQRPRR